MPFPTSVDAIVDAPPVTAATRITSSQVLGPQRITVGPVWFNLKSDQFGAVGDGATDDTAAVQKWINAIAGSGTNGVGIGFAPPGNYKLTATITNPVTLLTGLGFIGAGREVTIFTQTTQNIDAFQLAGSGSGNKLSNVFFQDMSIRGPNAGTSGFGINCNGDLELYRVWVQFHWTAVRITNGAYMHFEDSGLFTSVQDGLFLDTLNFNFESRGTRYSGNGRYGIFSPNAVNMFKISGGTCESNASRGMYLDGASTGLVLRDIYFENQGASVTEQIYLGATSAPLAPAVLDCHFTNTTAVNCKHIHVVSAANAIIAGNYIGTTGGSGTGISLDAGCTSALVMNNQNNASTVDSGTNTTILQPSGLMNLGGLISLRGGGGAPTLGALQTNISTQTISGGNNAFLVTVTTGGSGPTAGAIVAIVSFSSTFAVAPVVVVKTNTAIAADHDFAATDITTGGFNLRATNALNATQAYPISILAFGK